jgi:hypothetical protein
MKGHQVRPLGPPAIWTAFAKQGAWKDWVIVALIAMNVLLVIAGVKIARRDPDVVLVAADGKSTFVPRDLAGDALGRFLAEQRQQPSDVTVVHFTQGFLHLVFAINSSTVEGAWMDALALMSDDLRTRYAAEAAGQKFVEVYRLARIRTSLNIEDLQLVERTSTLLHVRAVIARSKASLSSDETPTFDDRLAVEVVERVVPRTMERPDGLEVAALTVTVMKGGAARAQESARSSP